MAEGWEGDVDSGEIDQQQQAIINATESPRWAGIVAITVRGQSDIHTGIQIGDRMVLTSSAWMDWQTDPKA